MRHRNTLAITAAAAFLLGACMDPTPPPGAEETTAGDAGIRAGAVDIDALVTNCNSCHLGALSLADWSASELAARIREVADGDGAHPAAVPALSDAELAALADALTSD